MTDRSRLKKKQKTGNERRGNAKAAQQARQNLKNTAKKIEEKITQSSANTQGSSSYGGNAPARRGGSNSTQRTTSTASTSITRRNERQTQYYGGISKGGKVKSTAERMKERTEARELQRDNIRRGKNFTGGRRYEGTNAMRDRLKGRSTDFEDTQKEIIKGAAQQQIGGYEKFIGNMTRGEATGKSGAMNRKLGGSSNTRRNDRLKPGQDVGKRPDNTETIKNIQKQRQKSADQISERGSKNIQKGSKAIEDIKERNLAGAITYDENGNPVVDKKKKRAGDFKNWMLDLEVAGLQMGGDALVGVGTGGLGGMASMFARAGGMAMDEAERNGASRDQATKYGLAIGGVEALTEKIGAVASPLRKVYGKGVTDTLMEKIIGKMAAKTTAGEIGQRTFMSALTEGLEEMVAEGVEPTVANKIYADTVASTRSDEVYNDAISKGYSEEEARRFASEAYNAIHQSTSLADIFRAGSIGAAMGGILGGAGNVIEAGRGAAIKDLYGKDGIREMAKKAKDSDDDTVVARATAILDQIDNGGDVTAGQANAVFNAVQAQEAKDDETMRRYDAGIYAEMRRNGYESPLVEDEENGVVGLNRIASDKYQAVMGEAREAASEVVDSKEESGAIADAIAAVMTGIASPQQVSMFTTSNPQARAVFESVTGETLPKSNAQMREKLFAMSARNFVETAKEETDYLRDQINGVLNIDMTQDYGSSGQSAFADVMEDEAIDPRDNNKTVAASAFEDYYRAGALGIPMEQILQNGNPQHSTLSMEQKQAAYEAGIRDAQAQTSIPAGSAIAMGKRLSMAKTGRPTGMLYVELSDETKPMFTGSQQRMYRELAKRLHINIHIVDDIVDDEGNVVGANGYYNKGEVYLSMNNDRGLELVFGHEVTHLIKAASPEAYAKLEELVRDRWEEQGGIDEAIKAKQEQYKGAVGQSLSESDALEEIIADATYEMFGDPEFVAKICAEEKTLGKTILYAIRTILANIRAALASSGGFTPSQNAQLLSQLDILSEFEDLWLQGLRDAARESERIQSETVVESVTEEDVNNSDSVNDFIRLSLREEEMSQDLVERLNGEKKVKVYRAMQYIDGRLYPPMAAVVDGDLNGGTELNKWEQAEERPDLGVWKLKAGGKEVDKDTPGAKLYFNLKKGNGTSLDARYNPYIHTSLSPLNDQFSSAYARPNMVVVEGEVPESELTSGYKADLAKDSVGETEWKSGKVAGELKKVGKPRRVILSRYFRPTRVLENDEVAQEIAKLLEGTDIKIPANVVTPGLLSALEERGVEIDRENVPKKYKEGETARFSVKEVEDNIRETEGKNAPIGVSVNNDGNIRYSIPTEYNNHLKGDGRIASVRAIRDDWMKGRPKERKALNKVLDQISDFMVGANDLYEYVSLDNVQSAKVAYRTDENGNPTSVILSCQVANGEYEVNFDFTTICKKRESFQKVIEDLYREGVDELDLTEENIFAINQELKRYGYETACPICFVEARRYMNKEYARKIVDTWNEAVEKINPNAEYFDFENADIESFDYPAIDKAFKAANIGSESFEEKVAKLVASGEVFQKKLKQSDVLTNKGVQGLKAMSNKKNSLFGYLKQSRGAAAPKEAVAFVAYNGEFETLPETMKKMPLADYLASIAGARLQSFSDFQIENTFDYMQLIAGMAARRVPTHTYSKEPAFVRIFGMTGMKINMSIVCDIDPNVPEEYAGMTYDDNGNLVYNFGEQSFPMEEARELQADKRYSKNVGTILVGLSDYHIEQALNDKDIRFIIPYHSSGLPSQIMDETKLEMARDYTKFQNTCTLSEGGIKALKKAGYETDIAKVFKEKGRKGTLKYYLDAFDKIGLKDSYVKKSAAGYGDFDLYGDINETKNPRTTADNYIEWCLENGNFPLFFQFAKHKNYYKVLYDFDPYDSVTERYAPQKAVQNIYPGMDITKGQTDTTELESIITEYLEERNEIGKERNDNYADVMTEIKANIFGLKSEARYSIKETDSDGNKLTEAQREYFAESKVVDEEGRLIPVYHGTSEEFYEFEREKIGSHGSYEGAGFNFTPSDTRAKGYEGIGGGEGRLLEGYLNITNPIPDDRVTMSAADLAKTIEKIDPTGDDIIANYAQDTRDYGSPSFVKREAKATAKLMLDYHESDADIYSDLSSSGANADAIISAFSDMGYDGVIHHYDDGKIQTLIAFDSNQFKNIDNTSPTDSNDIRYSVPEEPTPIPNEEDAIDYTNGDDSIYQYEYDGSPYAEAGKSVRFKSYAELRAKVEKLQADKRLTHGRVLDTKPIRKDVENMLRTMASIAEQAGNPVLGLEGRMSKSNAKLVDDIVKNANHIYKMMKSGREEEAVIAAMNVADDIVERIQVIDDAQYDTYKDMKKYLRETPITISEEDASSIPDFGTFKKNLFGKVRIVKEGGFPVDSVYEELMEMFPGVFDEELTHPADQLMAIADAREAFEPYDVMLTAEEREQLLKDTTMELLDIIAEGEPWKSWADKKSEMYQNKVKMLQERHREALRKLREEKNEKIERIQTKNREQRAERIDKKKRLKSFGSIEKNHKWLSDRLLKPSDDKHIPEGYQIAIAELLMALDLQTERSKALEEKTGRVAQKTFKFRELLDAYEEIANPEGNGILEYDDNIVSMLKDSLIKHLEGKSVDALDTKTMGEIDTLLKAIVGNIKNVNKAFAAERDQTIEEMAARVTADCNHIIDKRGTFSERKRNLKRYFLETSKVINIGMKKPREFFTHLGKGMTDAYMEIRHGEDKHFRNMQVLRGKFEEIFKQYNNKKKPGSAIEKWRDTSTLQTFELENGDNIKLNPSQVMSLYCLMKREQAQGHIFGSGIVPSKVEGISGKIIHKKNEVEGSKVMVTYGDVMKIIDSLTEEQRTMADQLQSLLNNEVAAWGNETSMLLYNYRKFTEENYFPIKSDDAYLDSNFEGRTAEERIRNFGFTKGTVANANNPIVIADIFEVVTDHCNKMSLYNSFAAPLADFTRLYNSRFKNDDGTLNISVKDMLTKAYGKDTREYIENFLADVNNNTQVRPDETRAVVNKFLANYKRATIGMNMRVAVQQPTAIVRAFDVIDPKYFVADKQMVAPWRIKRDIKEMCDHCPIAMWKSWGHNDVDMARDLDDIMMNKAWSRFDIVTMGTYGALDIWTWSKIWNAVKREVKAKNPGVEVGSDEYWDLCNERASEVFDRTQVVDSVLHRSQTMRSKDTMTKMISSFMAEPTTTFNMLQSDIAEARDLIMEGEKGKAAKKLTRCMTVFGLNAAAVSAAAAVIDLLRGKEPDDDDKDKEGFELWYANFLNNFIDNANPIKMIPYPSTAFELFEGTFGTSNMAFEGWESLAKGMRELYKFTRGESKKSEFEVMWMVGDGIGNVLGIPVKSIDKDYHALMNRLGISFASEKGSDEKVRVIGDDGSIFEFYPGENMSLTEKFFKMIGIENNSKTDNFLNKFGINLSEEEKQEHEYQNRKDEILKKCEGLEGEEREKKLWSIITGKKDEENLGITSYIESADFDKVEEMKKLYVACGGDKATFDEKVIKKAKTAYKKTIGVNDAMDRQFDTYDFLIRNGVSEAEISEIVKSSDTAREFKKAYALGDDTSAALALSYLTDAGISYEDYEYLCSVASRSVKASDYATGEFEWPTNGTVTSGFGHRSSPGGIGSTNHQGMDIGAPTGNPVTAADGGKVVWAGDKGDGYGNYVVIDHGNGYKTLYGHLSGYEVKQGQIVKKNQQIGKVGSTGNSTGPHLHFGVMENDHYVNPANYLQR